jgi:hypothetical protein
MRHPYRNASTFTRSAEGAAEPSAGMLAGQADDSAPQFREPWKYEVADDRDIAYGGEHEQTNWSVSEDTSAGQSDRSHGSP